MSNVDPHNNAPPPRAGAGGGGGGGCGGGTCGSPAMNQQYTGPPMPELQQQQQVPQYTGRTTNMSQRPMQTPGNVPRTENQMLLSDLQVAIQYIRQLGGSWPPPGQ